MMIDSCPLTGNLPGSGISPSGKTHIFFPTCSDMHMLSFYSPFASEQFQVVQTNELYISFSVFVNKRIELYMKIYLIVSLYN
ncbi:hypothetical protein SDC9_100094 [bioreactor metagenome]|uniref:Uncharacterized protein n=1 Tax=bioreactor metagenome TaxID=1076179 RepID=A0A645AJX1_9ZZZZ